MLARLSATMWLPSGMTSAPAPLNVAPASMLMLLFDQPQVAVERRRAAGLERQEEVVLRP